jgi:hypothetical protein
MQCVEVNAGYVAVSAEPLPCTGGFVLLTASEIPNPSGALPPLSIADAIPVAGAIVFCWVCGWVWGPIADAING